MKFLFRFLKILVVSFLTTFLVVTAGAYLLLSIPSIQQKIVRWGEQELVHLFDTRLSIGSSHIEPFNKIRLTDLCLYDRQGDTIFYAQDVMMGFALQELLQRRIVFTMVQVNDFDISLRRDTPEAPLNLQFILDLFKGSDSPAIDFHSQINTVLGRRGRIRYDISSLTPKEEGQFDPNHIEVDNLLFTVSLKALEKDSINVNIRKVSFDEKSGFSLQKFGVKVIGNRENILLNNFRIILPNSYIAISRTSTDLLRYRNPDDFIRQSLLDVQIQKSRITLSDFKAFSPRLADICTPMEITAQMQGTLADLSGSLNVMYGEDEAVFSMEVTAQELFSLQERSFSGKTDRLIVSNTALILQEFIPERPDLIERFAPLGEWRFSGEIDKTPDGVKADGYLSTALGDIEGRADMDILPEGDEDIFCLKGNMKSLDFDIGTLLSATPVLGQAGLDMDIYLKQRTQGGNLWGEAEGNVSHIEFKGYTYQNITFNGSYNGTSLNGLIAMNDPNAQIRLSGSLELFNERHLIHVSAEGNDIRLGQLNIAPQYEGSSTSFVLSSDFSGDHIDNIEGEIRIESLDFENNGQHFFTKQFTLTTQNNDSINSLQIASDFIQGGIEGKYAFRQIKTHLFRMLARYLPDLVKAPTAEEEAGENNFRYAFEIANTVDLSAAFDLPVTLQQEASLSGRFNAEDNDILLQINAPELWIKKQRLLHNEVSLFSTDTTLSLALHTGILNKKGQFTGWAFQTEAHGNTIASQLNWSNNSDTTFCGEIATLTRLWEGEGGSPDFHIDLLPTQIIIGDSTWNISQAGIDIVAGRAVIDSIDVRHQNQYLLIDGAISKDPEDNINLSLNDMNLDNIFEALHLKNIVFGGQATGNFILADLLNGEPRLSTQQLSVKDFSYNYARFGDLTAYSRWDNDNMGILLGGTVVQEGFPDTEVEGYIFPTRDSLHIHFDANHVSLNFLNPFTEKILQKTDGFVTGPIDFYGHFKALTIEGKAQVDRFGFGISYLNTRFYISDSIRFTPDAIIINNMTLADEEGHLGKVDGTVRHDHFKNIEYFLNASEIKNMLVYNTTELQNSSYYGKVYANGVAAIEGDLRHTNIDINMETDDKSKFTFVLSNNAEANEYQFITFVDHFRNSGRLLTDTLATTPVILSETPRNTLTLNLQINATPQMSMNLLMDPSTGDAIHVTGNGSIQLEYSTLSDLKLYGTYTVDKGNYNFNLQDLITKNFVIKSGSSISFLGVPQEATLNIEAYYALTANLEDLDESFATDQDLNRTNIPVHAMLYLTGDLQQPEFKFDLNFPTVTLDIDRRIRSIINSEDMINRQIIYLLALNKFYTPDYMNTGQTHNNELASVASSALSSQLNNLLGQINDNFNIGANFYSNKGDFSDMDVELTLSSQLINNRLILNGNIGYRDNAVNNNTFIGDFDLEYLLNKSGNIRLKAYNYYNDKNYYVKSALTTQGVGVMYRKEFNKWHEWVSWLYRKKKPATP